MRVILQKIIDYGLLATLIVFSLSINIALMSPDDKYHPVFTINFSLTDILIGLLLVLWAFKVVLFKEWKQLKIPPAPILAFVGVVLISFVNATSISDWAKEAIQMIEYFLFFYLLLLNNIKPGQKRAIFYTFYISTSLFLAIAFIQHTILDADVYLVRGLFENRNFLGAYLCMVLPLVFSELISSNKTLMKIWMASLLILSLWVLVSGSAVIALLISFGLVSALCSKKIFIRYTISVLIIVSIYPFVFPEKNTKAFQEFLSIYEQGSVSENYYRRISIVDYMEENTLFRKELKENYLLITTEQYFRSTLPDPEKGERYKDMEGKKQIKNRYLEMQASINLVSENTLLGVGAGNFQQHIGTSYNELPKVNTAEPGQHNGYLIVASTMGILGLATLIWLFINMLSVKVGSIKYNFLNIGIVGAVWACIIQNAFVYLFSASLLTPLIFIFYLSSTQNERYNADI